MSLGPADVITGELQHLVWSQLEVQYCWKHTKRLGKERLLQKLNMKICPNQHQNTTHVHTGPGKVLSQLSELSSGVFAVVLQGEYLRPTLSDVHIYNNKIAVNEWKRWKNRPGEIVK